MHFYVQNSANLSCVFTMIIYIYIYIYNSISIYTDMYPYAIVNICKHARRHLFLTHAFIYVSMCASVYACMHLCTSESVRLYIDMFT